MTTKPPNRMDRGSPGRVTPRFLAIQLPEDFPDPLRESELFNEAVEMLGTFFASCAANAAYTAGRPSASEYHRVTISYRTAGDPIGDALIAEDSIRRKGPH